VEECSHDGKLTPPAKRFCGGLATPPQQPVVFNVLFSTQQVNNHYYFDFKGEKSRMK
jgi:hypothetical protein